MLVTNIFSHFQQCFQKGSLRGSLKFRIVCKRVKSLPIEKVWSSLKAFADKKNAHLDV